MRYVIEIEYENAAFHPDPGREVARILHTLANTCHRTGIPVDEPLKDINGNTVGKAYTTDADRGES